MLDDNNVVLVLKVKGVILAQRRVGVDASLGA
jgi:hypothetical protein